MQALSRHNIFKQFTSAIDVLNLDRRIKDGPVVHLQENYAVQIKETHTFFQATTSVDSVEQIWRTALVTCRARANEAIDVTQQLLHVVRNLCTPPEH